MTLFLEYLEWAPDPIRILTEECEALGLLKFTGKVEVLSDSMLEERMER